MRPNVSEAPFVPLECPIFSLPSKALIYRSRPAMWLSFFRHFIQAKTIYDLHSPFVYDFAMCVLEDRRHFYAFDSIEAHRQKLLSDNSRIRFKDLGAGSRQAGSAVEERSIRQIAKHALSLAYQGRQLFHMVRFFHPKHVIELGTSLGISAMYLGAWDKDITIYTIEGIEAIRRRAQTFFDSWANQNIRSIHGAFDARLPALLKDLESVDLVYVDGHHTYEATIRYFQTCLPHVHNESILIFDDIYWSSDMTRAWEAIKGHEQVRATLDLFHFGIVCFRSEFVEKQHWKLVPSRWKPWRF